MSEVFISCNIIRRSLKTIILSQILLCLSVVVSAQKRTVLNNAPSLTIKSYAVLPDAHYSFNRIVTDSTLYFVSDSLKAWVSDYYWVKLTIANPYPNNENYLISLTKPLNYSLYYFDTAKQKWFTKAAGLNSPNRQRVPGVIACTLHKQAENTIYLKIDLRDIKAWHYVVKPAIVMHKKVTFNAREQFQVLSYLVYSIVLLSFAGYNLYVYFHLKDKAYLYYVIVQLGALVYFTGDNLFFNVFSPLRIYNLQLMPDLSIQYTDLNYFFEHVGVTILFWGFIQLTRTYLRTKDLLPAYDRLLKTLAYIYIGLEATPMLLTITHIYYLDNVMIVNAFILIIIIACLATGVVAYLHKVKAAKHFLAANLLPAVFAAGSSACILLYHKSSALLPAIAILSQILTFAVALVARVKLISDDLSNKAIEAMQLEADITITEYKRMLIEQENKHISKTIALEKERNELLQQKLEENQRELVGNSLYIHQKNKLLADLKTQMRDMDTLYPDARPEVFKNIQSSLKDGAYLDDEWDKFKLHFEQVHPSFFTDLRSAHPTLTKHELRLYAYFHINMSTKEIAALLNIAPASVRQAKARLNKKMST